ncbi:MAG: hypothetical protein MJ213_00425 [Bacilli bacterium]|nr:hypothetical protein [Bacilli bacterium]
MKKSKLITCLSATFVSAMALMSCSSLIKSRSGVILTVDGVEYTAEELFNDQKTPAAAEAKFNAVYKVAVRAHFTKDHPGYSDMDEITRNTKIKINEQKATAQSNAEKNGTKYDEEWEKILDSNSVEDEQGLYDKFEYELQKEKFEDKLYENNYDVLRSGGVLHGDTEDTPTGQTPVPGYLNEKMPYHMKHILVKVSAASGDNTTGTITADESEKLYNVIKNLASGADFDAVSNDFSDDTTAVESHASLGIMSRDTSFVDDFKLGTYFYEAEYGKSTSGLLGSPYNPQKAHDALFKDTPVAESWEEKIKDLEDPTSGETLGVIPYEAALKLAKKKDGGYADVNYEDIPNLTAAKVSKDNFKDKYLPRNIIFNKYFNKHNIMVIAPAKLPTYDQDKLIGDTKDMYYFTGDGKLRKSKDNYALTYDSTYAKEKGFSHAAKNGDDIIAGTTLSKIITELEPTNATGDQHILRDQNGRTIFVFRSGSGGSDDSGYQGIHFVVIERSPFIGKEFDDGDPVETNKKFTTLDEYYTHYYPGQSGGSHPQYEGTTDDKHTYVNYIMSETDSKKLKDRADSVKSELKKCTSDLNTYIYDYLIKTNAVKFNPDSKEAEAIQNSIETWIKINREDAAIEKTRSWDNNWQTYYYSLAAKSAEREEIDNKEEAAEAGYTSRLVPEACTAALFSTKTSIISFITSAFDVGGVFHE